MGKSAEKSSKKRERVDSAVSAPSTDIVEKVKDKKNKKEKKAKAAGAEEEASTETTIADDAPKQKKDKSKKSDKRKAIEGEEVDEAESRQAKKARKEAKAEKKAKKKGSAGSDAGAASSAAAPNSTAGGSGNFLIGADSSTKFDSELDALFAAAPPPAPAPVNATATLPSKPSSSLRASEQASSKTRKAAEEQVQAMETDQDSDEEAGDDDDTTAAPDTEDSGAEDPEEDDDEDLSSLASDEFDALYADDDEEQASEDGDASDAEQEEEEEEDTDGKAGEGDAAQFSESEDEAEDGDETQDKPLVHETLQSTAGALDKLAARRKREGVDEPAEVKDRRTVFVGNIPVEAVRSKTMEKALRRHIESFSPVPGLIKLDAVRFRSVPFSVPTDSIDRDGAGSLKAQKHRERAQMYKEASRQLDNEEGRAHGKVFLNANQKRKVAAINQELNTHAAAVNAYVTVNHPDSRVIKATWGEEAQKGTSVNAAVLAALLAVSINGSVFEGRHLRADVVTPLEPREVIDAGLDKLKSPSDGSLLVVGHQNTSAATDNKRTVFVGNLDFEAEEEELRSFFEKLVRDERGKPDAAQQIQFVPVTNPKSALHFGAKVVERGGEWVQDVRLIRDRATQMGKGFGYVRFIDIACVEEVLAAYKAEEAYIEALKAGRATKAAPGKRKAREGEDEGEEDDDDDDEFLSGAAKDTFRRRFKFRRRLIRVTPCKNTTAGASNGAQRGSRQPDRRDQGRPERGPGGGDRKPSAPRGGAPRGSHASTSSSDRPRQAVPIAAPEFASLSKEDRVAIKRADPTRNARRMEKKLQKKQQDRDGGDPGPKARVKLSQGKSMKRAGGGGIKKAKRA